MKPLDLRNCAKPIFVISLIALSFIALGLLIPSVSASHGEDGITQPLGVGAQTISFRDATSILLQSSILTVDTSEASSGSITINLEEPDANFDANTIQVVLSSVTSTTSDSVEAIVELTETGVDTGTFSGTLFLSKSATSGNNLQVANGDDISVFYEPESQGVGRFQAELDVGTAGNVKISDVLLDIVEFTVNHNFRPVTHPVNVELLDGATLNADGIVTISYANAVFQTLDNPAQLNMYYKRPDIQLGGSTVSLGWEKVRDFTVADPSSHNDVAMTITSDLATTQYGILGGGILRGTVFGQPVTGGQFMLGFEQGIGGGGGGGLVRPGLVVNALAGIGAVFGGGGGGGPPGPTLTLGAVALYDSASEIISLPQEIRYAINNYDSYTILESITDIYEDFDLPLSINGNGFALSGYENTLERQTIQPGESTEFKIVFYTNSEIAHTSLYFNLGPTRTIAGSDTQVLLYKDKPVEIIDPNGNIASATGSINNEGDLKRVVTFSITFSENIQWSNSDLVIRAWNDNLNSGDTIIYDAIQVLPSEEKIAFEESLPEPEFVQLKSQYVPIWIKNNAGWWSLELIDDADFIAGIEFLLQNEIITIPDDKIITDSSTQQIPQWIKNNAGWWSEDLITEQEFIDGLQWLIRNGIIQVTET